MMFQPTRLPWRRLLAVALIVLSLQACNEPERVAGEQASHTDAESLNVPVVDADFAFINVNVVSMQSDQAASGQTVIVNDGVISQVVTGDSISLSDATMVVDGQGRYLMPALTDMHDHIIGPETLKLQVAFGVSTVRNMFGSPDALKWRDSVAAGELFGPEIITGSPLIDDDPPYFQGSTLLTKPEDADALVADLKAKGYSFLKPYELLKEDVYVAMMAAADKYGMTVEGHVPQAVSADMAVSLGQKSIEHGMRIDAVILADGIPWGGSFRSREMVGLIARIDAGELVYEDAFSRDKLREWSRKAAAGGTAVVPTMAVVRSRAWADADREAIARHEQFKYVPLMFRDFWTKPIEPDNELISEGVMESMTDAEIASLVTYSTVEYGKWVKIMWEEGVLLLGGVDAPNPGMFHGYSLHDELRNLVELAGLSPYEAIKTVTVNPASYWGIEGRRGVVAAGAEADLLLVSANPLADVANTRAIEGVMMDGNWLDRPELDALLLSVEVAFAAAPETPTAASEESTE